jgi:DNA-binding response OmpR family regulator
MPTALVVADGSWVSNEVRSALSIDSWDIEEIHDPRAVSDRLEESRVDAVIIDLQVGSKGGMAVVRSIRQNFEVPERPRMVMLLDRSADTFLARRAGADAWVLKPFDARDLRIALGMRPPALASTAGADEEE